MDSIVSARPNYTLWGMSIIAILLMIIEVRKVVVPMKKRFGINIFVILLEFTSYFYQLWIDTSALGTRVIKNYM